MHLRHRSSASLLCAVLVASLAVTGQRASATPTSATEYASSDVRLEDASLEIAAQTLADQSNVTLAVARGILARQESQIELTQDAAAYLGDSFGGAFINQDRQGELVVSGADPDKLLSWYSRQDDPDAARLQVRQVEYSVTELQSVTANLIHDHRLQTLPYRAYIDQSTNRVVTQLDLSWVEPKFDIGVAQQLLESVTAEYRGATFVDDPSRVELAACDTTFEICDEPLRGGVEIDGRAACSSAFVVQSNIDTKRYLLTAGHCLDTGSHEVNSGDAWYTGQDQDLPARPHHIVGNSYNMEPAGDGNGPDFGMLTVRSAWSTSASVLVQSSGGLHPTTRDETYDISGTPGVSGNLPQFAWLCKTGATSDTSCGIFVGVGNAGVTGTRYGIITGMLACAADSGGAIYIGHKGYGILVSRSPAQMLNTPRWGDPAGTVNHVCNIPSSGSRQQNETRYQGLSEALNAMNVHLL